MTTKTVEDLREHLFATLEALRDKEHPMDVDRARAISEVAKTVIASAKVENEYLRINGGGESAFVGAVGNANVPPALRDATRDATRDGPPANGIAGIVRHRLAG